MSALVYLVRRRAGLAREITDRQYARSPGLAQRFGEAGRAKCEADAAYHLDYLGSAAEADSDALFVSYVAWAKALLAHLGIGAEDLRVNLTCIRDSIAADSAAPPSLLGPLDAALLAFDALPASIPSHLEPSAPHAGLARRYLDLVRAGRRPEAIRAVLDAADAGVDLRALYLGVFQPVQREIGRLWQENALTVAEEHYVTAVTQLAISQLYPRLFSGRRIGRTLVATCATGELHELGPRMVADFFELEGWDTHYLGANVPIAGVVATAVERRADLVAISATIAAHVPSVGASIRALRARPELANARILVGGYPFQLDPGLATRLGADGVALDADDAVKRAAEWV